MIDREIVSWVRGEAGLRRHVQRSSWTRGHHGGGTLRSVDRQSLASLVVSLHLSVSLSHLHTQNNPLTINIYKLTSTFNSNNIASSVLTAKFFWGQFRSFTDKLKRNVGQFLQYFLPLSRQRNMFCLERCQMVIFESRKRRVLCREILITGQK